MITRYMVLTSEIVHDTLERDCDNEIANGQAKHFIEPHSTSKTCVEKLVHSSLESEGEDELASNHVRSNSVAQRDA